MATLYDHDFLATMLAACKSPRQWRTPGELGAILWAGEMGTGTVRDTTGGQILIGTPIKSLPNPRGTWVVTQLDDMTGNGCNFTPMVDRQWPSILMRRFRGKQAISFDSVNGTAMVSAPFPVPPTQPLSIVLIGAKRSSISRTILAGSDSVHRTNIFMSGGIWRQGTTATFFSGPSWDIKPFNLISVFNGASSSMMYRGQTNLTGDAGTERPLFITLGSRYDGVQPCDIDVAQVAVIPRELTLLEKFQLRVYSVMRHGIP